MKKLRPGAWLYRVGRLLRGRTFTAAGLAVAVCLSLLAVAENVKILYIADGAETGVALALRDDPTEKALSRAGITLRENDIVTTRETSLVYSRVSIQRGMQVTLQVGKLIDVIGVTDVTGKRHIDRELILVEIATDSGARRAEILDLATLFKAAVAGVSQRSVTLQMVGSTDVISDFMLLLAPYTILDLSRSGRIAVAHGGS